MLGMERRERDTSLDALKGLLILLVIIGHAIEQVSFFSGMSGAEKQVYSYLYNVIYSFHMGVFVFLSGFFTGKGRNGREENEKIVGRILIPFLVFQAVFWVLISRRISGLFIPRYVLWYMLSLFFWRILIRPLSRFKFLFPVSLAMAILIGFTKADALFSISRTVAFFPFFVAGYQMNKETIAKIRRLKLVWVIPLMLLSFAAALLLCRLVPGLSSAVKMNSPYQSTGLSNWEGAAVRAVILLTGFTMTVSLLAAAPYLPKGLCRFGVHSVTIYLGHAVLVKMCGFILARLPSRASHWVLPIYIIAVTGCAALVFSSPWAVRLYDRIVQWISGVVLKKDYPEKVQ